MDFDRALHNQWDRENEGGLPDSRLRGPRRRNTTVVRAKMLWERVFCADCGHEGGLITADWSPHVFYLCDDCFHTKGVIPGTVEAKPEVIE